MVMKKLFSSALSAMLVMFTLVASMHSQASASILGKKTVHQVQKKFIYK